MNRKIRNIVISDIHAGSSTAIFPPKITLPPLMKDEKNRTRYAEPHQERIYDHLMACAKRIKKESKGEKKVVVINGDLIEGLHHYTIQISVPMISDMVLVATEVLESFLDTMGFSVKNGDELKIGSGTETHTGFTEAGVAKHFEPLGAEYYDELRLNQNGFKSWFVHQWVGVGKGHNEGNGIYNGLKSMYYDSLKEKKIMPDLVVGSHFHKSGLGSFSQNWQTHYGIITPSLQSKTRHGLKVSAFERNDIGIIVYDVSETGLPKFQDPWLMV